MEGIKKGIADILRADWIKTESVQNQILAKSLEKDIVYMGGDDMKHELTPEQVMEIGKMWGDIYLSAIPVEKRLAGLRPEERLAGLSVKEIENYLRKLKSRKKDD